MNTTTTIAPVSPSTDKICSWCECAGTYSETYPPCGDGYGANRTHVDYACDTHAVEFMGIEPPMNPTNAPHTITIRKAGQKPHIILRYSRKGLIERAAELTAQLGFPTIAPPKTACDVNQHWAMLEAFYAAL